MLIQKKIISTFFLVILFSCQVLATFNEYLEELDGTSGYNMSQNTKNRLTTYYDNSITPLHGAALDSKHDSFNASKAQLIQDWERYTKLAWPTYAYPTKVRKYGDRFDAHHIIPQSSNGPNVWWNLFPLTNTEHHKVHTNNSTCSQLFPNSRGAGRAHEQYLQP